jgi:hypothetical protein
VFAALSIPSIVGRGDSDHAHDPPRLIHFVLDEHIGLEGIPTDWPEGRNLEDDLRSFYRRWGFYVYGGAYSHYYDTEDSLSNLFNFTTEALDNALVSGDQYPPRIKSNRYFEILHERGYRWHVVGSGYLDLCSGRPTATSCLENRIFSLGGLAALELTLSTRISLLMGAYLSRNHYYQEALWMYVSRLHPWLVNHGIPAAVAPQDSIWTNRKALFFSANGMLALDNLAKDILDLALGDALLAHILLPHHP